MNKPYYNNRLAISDDTDCGCFFCISIYKGKEITDWADKGETALCPNCGVDSLIPNETDEEYLTKMCEKWFTGAEPIEKGDWKEKIC